MRTETEGRTRSGALRSVEPPQLVGPSHVSLVALFAAAPEVYYRAMNLSSAGAGILFLLGISAFIALLGVGVLRRWRWLF